jgi:hypothetical protein
MVMASDAFDANLVFIALTSSSSLVAILQGLGGLGQLGSVGSFGSQSSLIGACVCRGRGCVGTMNTGIAVEGKTD